MTDNDAFFQNETADDAAQRHGQAVLQQHGWAPADDRISEACSALLMTFLRDHTSADLATLIPRAQEFVDRPSTISADAFTVRGRPVSRDRPRSRTHGDLG
jgi:hypothetical protein